MTNGRDGSFPSRAKNTPSTHGGRGINQVCASSTSGKRYFQFASPKLVKHIPGCCLHAACTKTLKPAVRQRREWGCPCLVSQEGLMRHPRSAPHPSHPWQDPTCHRLALCRAVPVSLCHTHVASNGATAKGGGKEGREQQEKPGERKL